MSKHYSNLWFSSVKYTNSDNYLTLDYWYSMKILHFYFHPRVLPSVMSFDCPKNRAKNICTDCPAKKKIFEFVPLSLWMRVESIEKLYFWNGILICTCHLTRCLHINLVKTGKECNIKKESIQFLCWNTVWDGEVLLKGNVVIMYT